MPRSGDDARRRLRQAALELYREHGFDGTTAAGIAARAGLNERTFFRHFADKREVLFDGEADLRALLVEAIVAAPADLAPLDALVRAYEQAGALLEAERPFTEPRLAIVAETPALQERELAKGEMLAAATAAALRERGVEQGVAELAAHVGWTTFHHAAAAWIRDPGPGFPAHLERAVDDLRSLAERPRSGAAAAVRG